MVIRIPKDFRYTAMLALCVSAPYLNNYELTFLIWAVTLVMTIQKRYAILLVNQIICFSLILLIGIFSSIGKTFTTYDFIRDITYLLKPIMGLLVGYQLCKGLVKEPIKAFIDIGVGLAAIHIGIVIYGYLVMGFTSIHHIRAYAGYFSDYEVYTIILVLFSSKLGAELTPKKKQLFLGLLFISSFLYLSRTNFIQLGILWLAMQGYFNLTKKTIRVLLSLFIALIALYSALVYYNPRRNGPGMEAFLYKVKIAPTEPFKTKINTKDYKDFNDNYRSVENINTIEQVGKEGYSPILFGEGLGSQIDIKQIVWLDGVQLRFISILHNGFMTVYLKSGLAGVIVLLISIFLLFRRNRRVVEIIPVNNLIVGTAIFLFLSYWVFMGMYFKADTKAILLGGLFAYRERILKSLTQNTSN